MKFIRWSFALILALGISTTLAAQGKSGGKNTATVGDKIRTTLPPAERVFRTEEISIIRNYFRDNRSGLPPGLAKRESLPPGLERQLRKNGKLPPGLQKKLQPFPDDLERRLRVLPTGWRRVVIAGNVIMMNEKTATIYDIVRNVIQ